MSFYVRSEAFASNLVLNNPPAPLMLHADIAERHEAETIEDHRSLIAALPAAERAHLVSRTNRHAAIRLAQHGAALTLTSTIILSGMPGWWLALVPQGVLLVFLFTAMHEATHETAFASAPANRALRMCVGFVLLISPTWFRGFHFAHHRHTNDPAHDPELAIGHPTTWHDYLWRLTGLPLWWAQGRVLVRLISGNGSYDYLPARSQPRAIREARVFAAIYIAIAALSVLVGSAAAWWLWIAPMLLGQPFLRAYLMAEHHRCPQVANMLANSRTTFTNRAMRWLAWNMPFHAEHHAYPSVPFHRLPAFHALTRPHLTSTSDGYRAFHGEMQDAMSGSPGRS
ncbi:MAG: fatty acid desaturase [Pseudomonadota bacterium]